MNPLTVSRRRLSSGRMALIVSFEVVIIWMRMSRYTPSSNMTFGEHPSKSSCTDWPALFANRRVSTMHRFGHWRTRRPLILVSKKHVPNENECSAACGFGCSKTFVVVWVFNLSSLQAQACQTPLLQPHCATALIRSRACTSEWIGSTRGRRNCRLSAGI